MSLRSIIRKVLPVGKHSERFVGTTDLRGKGTTHSLADVDPVVLCDGGVMEGKGIPPYGLHPHYGLIATTTIFSGSIMDADNINGASDQLNQTGGIYVVSAGKGVCHEEHTATEGSHDAMQTIFKIPNDKSDLPPELIKATKDQIPVIKIAGGELRLNLGKLGDVESPANPKALPRVVMARAFVEKGKKMEIPLDADLEHGFVYIVSGECKVGKEGEILSRDGGILLFGSGGNLCLDNEGKDSVCEALVVAGKPLNEPWVKLLVNSGFIIANDEETAQRVEEVIFREGNDFTYEKVEF